MRFLIFISALFILFSNNKAVSQGPIQIQGQLYDTVNKKGVEYAVIMAIKVRDSVIQNFTRSDWEGKFLLSIPRDTFEIQISLPSFESRSYFVFGNAETKDLDFGKVVLPPKGEELKEFVVFSNSEPIFLEVIPW